MPWTVAGVGCDEIVRANPRGRSYSRWHGFGATESPAINSSTVFISLITFTVEDTSEVQKVEMKDDVTKVQISKTDISGKELPGAKLTILDKDGKTVESWTSEEKPHYIEMLPIGEYTLREETAPDGYLVAEDVKFTVKDTGEIQKVVMKDEVKPTETPTETPAETPETTSTPETKDTETTKTSTSPKTGDNTPILFWILLTGVGMAGVGGTVILRKKKKK